MTEKKIPEELTTENFERSDSLKRLKKNVAKSLIEIFNSKIIDKNTAEESSLRKKANPPSSPNEKTAGPISIRKEYIKIDTTGRKLDQEICDKTRKNININNHLLAPMIDAKLGEKAGIPSKEKYKSDTCLAGNEANSSVESKISSIVAELLTTEEAYVGRLTLIEENFRKFFLSKADAHERSYPSAKTIDDMFSNLYSIISFHTNFFLPELSSRIKNWDKNKAIGDIFLKYGPHFGLYTIYINSYDNACAIINSTCKKYSKFQSDLLDIEKKPECKSLKLIHHMLNPIQRIPRYKMLLAELLKKTNIGTVESENLQRALEIVSDYAQKANDRISETQNALKVLEIQYKFTDCVDIVSVGRSFIKEGDLQRKNNKNGKFVACHLFLFSDILLYCVKNSSNKWRKKSSFEFSGISLKCNLADQKQPNTFAISNVAESIIFSTLDPEEREAWINSIKAAVAAYDGGLCWINIEKNTSFLIKNRGAAVDFNTLNLHVVLLAPIYLYDKSNDGYSKKLMTLTPEHKLIIGTSVTPSPSDKIYTIENCQISVVILEAFEAICINFVANDEKLVFTSPFDDLFIERILNTCITRTRSKSST
ncbi:hypothetical protein MXB_5553 [Myxobolus squamalis]|nr:hypothetical protein MXB_5553 [Myxobolus squamalis]